MVLRLVNKVLLMKKTTVKKKRYLSPMINSVDFWEALVGLWIIAKKYQRQEVLKRICGL